MSARVDIDLYQHAEKPGAVLLSLNGRNSAAHWIPRSLLELPRVLAKTRVDGALVQRGRFGIDRWKAEHVGFVGGEDENQGALF